PLARFRAWGQPGGSRNNAPTARAVAYGRHRAKERGNIAPTVLQIDLLQICRRSEELRKRCVHHVAHRAARGSVRGQAPRVKTRGDRKSEKAKSSRKVCDLNAFTKDTAEKTGHSAIPRPWSLVREDLDEHFGFPIIERIEQANGYFRERLHKLLEA